ncbi:MAG TPA: hypothetical protein PKX40_01010 [Spirochaetota bacterium]|nr:hypothetical protein [Spirochaetota bacterium]
MSAAYAIAENDVWSERQNYVPRSYSGAAPSFTADDIQSDRLVSDVFRRKISIPLWNVKAEQVSYKTRKPIQVNIFEDDGLYFAENETLNVCGYGETKEKAIFDLSLHIIYYYNYYNGINEADLMDEGIRLKNLYRDLLIRE